MGSRLRKQGKSPERGRVLGAWPAPCQPAAQAARLIIFQAYPGSASGSKQPPMSWDPALYLSFGDHRTRPAADLLARVPLKEPGGSSTWAAARAIPPLCLLPA